MGRDNYSFKKRQRELATKKKQEEKLKQKLERKNAQPEPEAIPAAPAEDGTSAQQQ